MARYILLRDKTGNWRRPALPLSGGLAPEDPAGPADARIEVADLTPQEVREASAVRDLLAIVPAMPTRLLAPEPMDELRPDDVQPGWGLRATGADWTPVAGAGVHVALLDTGIDAGHPAFAGVDLRARDFAGTGVADANGHGTHVAATVLGRDLGGTRIGVARGITRLVVGKAVADGGHGRSGDFLAAFAWALRQAPDILGFSIGFDMAAQVQSLEEAGTPQPLATCMAADACRGNLRVFELLLRMAGPGAPLVLGAVGNDSLRTVAPDLETGPAVPAGGCGVLAVAACGPGDDGLVPAPFSNTGAALSAPGVGIVSAGLGGGLRSFNGSSMAMAHAAGIAALWVEAMRTGKEPADARALTARLVASATRAPLDPRASALHCGRGLVQAPGGSLD